MKIQETFQNERMKLILWRVNNKNFKLLMTRMNWMKFRIQAKTTSTMWIKLAKNNRSLAWWKVRLRPDPEMQFWKRAQQLNQMILELLSTIKMTWSIMMRINKLWSWSSTLKVKNNKFKIFVIATLQITAMVRECLNYQMIRWLLVKIIYKHWQILH